MPWHRGALTFRVFWSLTNAGNKSSELGATLISGSNDCRSDLPLDLRSSSTMNDLSNVEWTAPKASPSVQQYPQASGNYYPALRPTPPISGRSTPPTLLSTTQAPSNPPIRSNASTPANDSFANLVSFNTSQANKGLSLEEQQRKLQEKIRSQEVDKRKAFDARFGAPQTTPWDNLENGRTTTDRVISPPTYTATSEYGGQKLSQVINKPFAGIPIFPASNGTRTPKEDEDDILAAFSASAPVDSSSHMPNPSRSSSIDPSSVITGGKPLGAPSPLKGLNGISGGYTEGPHDDPFGLGTDSYVEASGDRIITNGAAGEDDDDDVLGLLGRPVSEFPKKPTSETATPQTQNEVESHPQERAVAELVDMGFPPDSSRRALETTGSGTDVQAAVGWLLNQAHEDSRKTKKSQTREEELGRALKSPQSRRAPGRRKSSTSGAAQPAWMREQEGSNSSQRRSDRKSPVNGEKDPAQYASELGNKVFKTAGSLWKTSTKKLNQAVQEFNSDSDSSQPKWMRDAQPEATTRKPRVQQRESDTNEHDRTGRRPLPNQGAPLSDANVTDEALMLEADSRTLPRKSRVKAEHFQDESRFQREQSPTFAPKPREKILPQPKFMQQAPPRDPKAKLSRQTVEEETSQAYISPARRKRPTPKPTNPEPEPDMLLETYKPSSQPVPSHPNPKTRQRPISAAPAASRSLPPQRTIPFLSPFALQASTKERQEGNGAFKRGDYAQATIHYSKALDTVPSTHPIAIILLTNRALSHSKVGDAKASLADAKSALDFIGLSRGTNETIDLGDGEGQKPMSTYWEKAMSRQAEALEHLERWTHAAAVWRICVEAGVGGASSIAGRNRSEKAAAPPSQPKPSAPKKVALRSRPKATALGDLAPDSGSVTRLRAANAAADRIDDEKFALADAVGAGVSKWRAGKEGNLRALLSTLDNVLWSDSGWKKVGMGDLLLPGKVKVVYMKGIAKVHPDKVNPSCLIFCVWNRLKGDHQLPTTATTEQKMISAAVFATLNEAWEKFKTENGL